MAPPQNHDAVLIGAARGAIKLAPILADAGWMVDLVERRHFGGTYVNDFNRFPRFHPGSSPVGDATQTLTWPERPQPCSPPQ